LTKAKFATLKALLVF